MNLIKDMAFINNYPATFTFRNILIVFICSFASRLESVEDAQEAYFPKQIDPVSGSPLCATSEPSIIQDGRSTIIVAAGLCTEQPNCIGFNYRVDLKSCQLFLYKPTAFGVIQNCLHFQVLSIIYM